MMDKIFRIRQWKSGGIIMPNRFSEFKPGGKRLLYDDERLFATKIKQLTKQANMLNQEYVRLAFTCEEFTDNEWKILSVYPTEVESWFL